MLTCLLKKTLIDASLSIVRRELGRRSLSLSCRCLAAPKTFYSEQFLSLEDQSVLLPGPERIRASKLIDDPLKFVTEVPDPRVVTVFDLLTYGVEISNDGDFLGTKNPKTGVYEWIKYSEAVTRAEHIGSALVEMGHKPGTESLVGAFASNRSEFTLIMFACAGYSMVLVPLYNSLGAENINRIIQQANFPFVIVNSNANAMNILRDTSKVPSLKTIVLMDPPVPELTNALSATNIQLMSFTELEEIGKCKKHSRVMPKPEDLYCIPYTSGTTGLPKGVMLTHANVITCIGSLVRTYGPAGVFGGTILSYLPPAHIYEIINQLGSAYFARRIAYYTDDIRKIFEEIRVIKPTVLPFVPRLMNVMYSRVSSQINSSMLKRLLVKVALSRKEKMLRKGIVTNKSIWDKLVFKKFQEALGGEQHVIISTSAPLSREVTKFFRCASGCYFFEAYGQTEVLGGTMTLPYEYDGGFVGPPFPCNHLKLADVPEMNYFAKDDVGEICFRGPNTFKGYYKNEQQTREAIDEDGWHHSGDIGRWLPNGTLKIIDRKKHLFKLSQGEYIAPEKVENAYSHAPIVLQVYIDGLSDKDYVVAVVVPEPAAFAAWAKAKGFKAEKDQLLSDKEVRKEFLMELHKYGEKEGLNSLEQAKNLFLTTEPFTVENNFLTPTLKLRRNETRKHYQVIFEKMYSEGQLVKSLKH